MSSGKKRHLSQSPHRSSEHKCKSLHEGKRGKYTRDESESSSRSSSISSSDASPERKSHRKKKDRKRKHRHRSSSSDSSSPKQKKKKKEKKKKKDKKKKKKELKTEKHKKEEKMCKTPVNSMNSAVNQSNKRSDSQLAAGPSPRVMKPMTKEEWEKQQSIVRRVYDPETGRNRLVKGDGEIIEEIVSKDRHRDINKQATRGDGAFYQATLGIQDK